MTSLTQSIRGFRARANLLMMSTWSLSGWNTSESTFDSLLDEADCDAVSDWLITRLIVEPVVLRIEGSVHSSLDSSH